MTAHDSPIYQSSFDAFGFRVLHLMDHIGAGSLRSSNDHLMAVWFGGHWLMNKVIGCKPIGQDVGDGDGLIDHDRSRLLDFGIFMVFGLIDGI